MKNIQFIYAPLWIFIVGVSSIILARYIFYVNYPVYFDGRVPSISKSVAFGPGVHLFSLGMIIVCALCFITVNYVQKIYHNRLNKIYLPDKERNRLSINCNRGCLIARMAAIFLVLLSIITLETNETVHIILSILFFSSQNVAFVYDYECTKEINKHAQGDNSIPRDGKHILFFMITCLSILYLFMYLYKDSTFFTDTYKAHQLYTIIEYLWATLAFLYPALYYPLIKKEFGNESMKNSHAAKQ